MSILLRLVFVAVSVSASLLCGCGNAPADASWEENVKEARKRATPLVTAIYKFKAFVRPLALFVGRVGARGRITGRNPWLVLHLEPGERVVSDRFRCFPEDAHPL